MRSIPVFIPVVAVIAAGVIGALGTAGNVGLYQRLSLPGWAPSAAVFGPVWSILYILLAVAGGLVGSHWGERWVTLALGLFIAQLVLQAAWTPLFFGANLYWGAFIDIVVLLALAIAATVVFTRISWLAAALMVPYLVWVAYAASLNGWIAVHNP